MCAPNLALTLHDYTTWVAKSCIKTTTCQSNDEEAGDRAIGLNGSSLAHERDLLDERRSSKPGKVEPYASYHQQVTAGDVVHLHPSATLR